MTIFLAIAIPLFISLIAYAASLTLKHIEYRGIIDSLNEKLKTARSELASLNEKKNQEISDIKKMSDARIEELTETAAALQPTHNNILLDVMQAKILLFLWKQPNSIEDKIAEDLRIELETIRFHLEELRKLKMVRTTRHGGNITYDVWLLDHEGRRYLIENKLT